VTVESFGRGHEFVIDLCAIRRFATALKCSSRTRLSDCASIACDDADRRMERRSRHVSVLEDHRWEGAARHVDRRTEHPVLPSKTAVEVTRAFR
jgi:hypothetical protein